MLKTKLSSIKNLQIEVNMDASYAERGYEDDWDAASVFDRNYQGVTYNYSYDGKNEMSAFYKTDRGDIDETTFKAYEIDFGLDDWKERLVKAMTDAYYEMWA